MTDDVRDAVILLSGMHGEDVGESVDETATRFADALEAEAGTVSAQFMLEEGREEDYGRPPQTYKTRIVVVSRKDAGSDDSVKLFDLYSMDWRDTLVGGIKEKRPVTHLLTTFMILLSNSRRLLFSIRRRSKHSAEKWQVRIGWIAYFVKGS